MTSPWIARLGRLALARQHYGAIGGWRRLGWRLWWRDAAGRMLKAPPPEARVLDEPYLRRPTGPVHYSLHRWTLAPGRDAGRGIPFCGMGPIFMDTRGNGLAVTDSWTLDYSAVTCEDCRREALHYVLAYRVGTR